MPAAKDGTFYGDRRRHKRHRKHKRRHKRKHVYFYGIYPYYRPYYYGAYYPDPYYYEPAYNDDYVEEPRYEKLTCHEIREILYDYGYTRVRSYDCGGTVYGFYAQNRGRSYKIRISASTADVLSRRRI